MNRSLKANTDENNKINDIRLSLNTPRGSKIVWILVEGEDDCKIYPKFFDNNKARVEYINGGKAVLTKALTILTAETQQVIGIQDADLAHLTQSYPNVPNLFCTDYHDIEMTMLSFEGVRNNLLTEFRLQDKQDIIWQSVLKEASYMGYIRWYNDINDCKINFEGLKYGDLNTSLSCEIVLEKAALLGKLNQRSKHKECNLTERLVADFIKENNTDDILNLCNGHDVVAFISLIIGSGTTPKSLAGYLRVSFSGEHFKQTALYKQLLGWQGSNNYYILY